MSWKHYGGLRRAVIAAAAVVSVASTIARAQEPSPSLSLESDHFIVGAGSKFLIMTSYFDGMRAYDRSPASLRSDFQFLKSHAIDGVRIFPNWLNGGTLFHADGSLDSARLSVLKAVIQIANEEKLVVDVSFAREPVGMDVEPYKQALRSAAIELAPYRNVLFDIQNERDLSGRPEQYLSQPDVQDARNRVKSVDPARIVTASNTGESGDDGTATAAMQLNLSLDVAAFHDPRYADWWDWRTPWIIQNMWYYSPWNIRVYLQEPQAWQNDPDENHHLAALHNSKRYGAAAWTFHTRSGFDLGTFSLQAQLSAGEQTFFNRVRDELPTEDWSACNFLLSTSTQDVPNFGGDFSVYLDTRWSCAWNAFRQDPAATWTSFTSASSGSGSSTITYHVDANPGGYRETKLTVGTRILLIRQQ